METFEQVKYLRERGIYLAQGYAFAPPLPGPMFRQLLEAAADAGAVAKAWQVFLAGLAEGTAPLIVAFALLAVAWLLVAVGLRRQP